MKKRSKLNGDTHVASRRYYGKGEVVLPSIEYKLQQMKENLKSLSETRELLLPLFATLFGMTISKAWVLLKKSFWQELLFLHCFLYKSRHGKKMQCYDK